MCLSLVCAGIKRESGAGGEFLVHACSSGLTPASTQLRSIELLARRRLGDVCQQAHARGCIFCMCLVTRTFGVCQLYCLFTFQRAHLCTYLAPFMLHANSALYCQRLRASCRSLSCNWPFNPSTVHRVRVTRSSWSCSVPEFFPSKQITHPTLTSVQRLSTCAAGAMEDAVEVCNRSDETHEGNCTCRAA